VHNEVWEEGEGSMQRSRKRLKLWKCSHGSPVTILACTRMCTNTWTETPQRTRKRKARYQDTICSEAEEGNGDRPWEVLYNYIVDPAASQPSEETSGVFPLMERTFPLAFMELVTAGKHILRPLRTIFVSYNNLCHLANTVVGNMRAR